MLHVCLLLAAALAAAQPQSAPPDSAALRVGNREVFVFRSALGPSGPAERAESATRRIELGLKEGAGEVKTVAGPEGMLVLLDGRAVFVVTPADVDTLAGESLAAGAGAAARQLETAIAETREARSLASLLVRLGLSVLATALLVAAVRLLTAGRRRFLHWLPTHGGRIPEVSFRGLTLLRKAQVLGAGRTLVTGLTWAAGIVFVYLYVTFVLTRFPWTRPWGEALGQYLVNLLARLGLGALHAIPDLFTVAVIFLATRLVLRGVRNLFVAVERKTFVIPGIHSDTAQPTRRIVSAIIWLFAVVVAYPYLPGSQSAAFKGVSVFTGLLLTLGSAGMVGQAMSGLVLMYARAFKVGDFIRVGETEGTVVEMGLLSTRIRTPKNEFVSLPNGVIVTGRVVNYSAKGVTDRPLLLYSSVTIGYGVPWAKVHELLVAAAQRTEGVLSDPAAFVLQRGLGDWYVEYQLNVALDPERAEEMPRIYSRLHANVQDAFAEAGVEIMSPSYFALRDGNQPALPPGGPPKARPPSFRVEVDRE